MQRGSKGKDAECGTSRSMGGTPIDLNDLPIFAKVGVTSLIVVRLRARTQNLGFIALVRTNSGKPAYTEDDLHLVQDLADRAALAIDTGRLLEALERRVAERTSALELQNKELEAFASSVSHDLRSPLRVIDGFSRILEEDHGATLDGDAKRAVAAIRRNARQMSQLVDDLLRLSRTGYEAIELAHVAMGPLVEAVVAGVRSEHRDHVPDIRIHPLPDAIGSAELLRQVWINLIGNAAKYTRGREPGIVQIAGERTRAEVRYTVTDNGVGFDPAQTDKLFTIFHRLHSASEFEGTGVGLALVQRIVVRHGGRVWAEGRPGSGATFGFALPAS